MQVLCVAVTPRIADNYFFFVFATTNPAVKLTAIHKINTPIFNTIIMIYLSDASFHQEADVRFFHVQTLPISDLRPGH